MNHINRFSTLFATFAMGTLALPALADEHHQVALDTCARAISQELAIADEAYDQDIRRIRGTSTLVKLQLRVVDKATEDRFTAKCSVRVADEEVVQLQVKGRSDRADARAVAALN